MSSNVVNLEQYRSETQRTDEEAAAQPAELSTMSYAAVCDWAGADFERLIAAARARDYYPTWIQHQISNHGFEPRPAEAAVLARMIAEVGPYIPKRER